MRADQLDVMLQLVEKMLVSLSLMAMHHGEDLPSPIRYGMAEAFSDLDGVKLLIQEEIKNANESTAPS